MPTGSFSLDYILSLEDIAVVKVAILICTSPELKKEILCAPITISEQYDKYKQKQIWNEIIEKKAAIILSKLKFPQKLQPKVMDVVFPIGMSMLIWAEYHEGTLGFSREFSICFLNSYLFTHQGMIDNKKAAKELMNNENLSIEQKYQLACLHCFADDTLDLFRQMTKEHMEKYYSSKHQFIEQPGLVKFWSYYLLGKVNEIKGEMAPEEYMLEKAIESGSKSAVEYCFEQTNLKRKRDAIVYAAIEAVRYRIIAKEDDWVVFRNRRYDGSKESWVPTDNYVDIVFSLLSNMSEDQQIEFLKKDIEGIKYEREPSKFHRRSRVLEFLLSWPYQDYFMKITKLMWEFLPEINYAILLLDICDRIEPKKEKNLKYGDEKSYDYRRLLKEFWQQSPEHYKRYILSKCEFGDRGIGFRVGVEAGVVLLDKLLRLKNPIHEDRMNVKLILDSATDKEKQNIFSVDNWKEFCIKLMEEDKWKELDWFIQNCLSSKEEEFRFKRNFFYRYAIRICTDFVKNNKWNSLETAIKWSELPAEKINKLKYEICLNGKQVMAKLFLYDKQIERVDTFIKWCLPSEEEINAFKKKLVFSKEEIWRIMTKSILNDKQIETVDTFVKWCLPSEEEVKAFKKEFLFSYEEFWDLEDFVKNDQLEIVNEFVNSTLPSEEEIKEFKKNVIHKVGTSICAKLISYCSFVPRYIDENGRKFGCKIIFNGGLWVQVEKLLTWCFSSEKEISEFKKNELLKAVGVQIHYELINSNQWEEAERFFAWLELSAEEIKELKKETLFTYARGRCMFTELMHSEEGNFRFVEYGSKQEAIELFLRWYLTDKETVLEFKDEFKRPFRGKTVEDEAVLNNFDFMIDQRLRDIDEEKMILKRERKPETSPFKKRLRKSQ